MNGQQQVSYHNAKNTLVTGNRLPAILQSTVLDSVMVTYHGRRDIRGFMGGSIGIGGKGVRPSFETQFCAMWSIFSLEREDFRSV